QKTKYVSMGYNESTDQYEGSLAIDEMTEEGNWQIYFISAMDEQDNYVSLYNSNTNNYGENRVDLSTGDFIVSETVADITAPEIDVSSLKVSQTEAKPGDRINISVKATDDMSGIRDLSIYYYMPITQKTKYVSMGYNESTDQYEGSLAIDEMTEEGNWQIYFISAMDAQDNNVSLYNSNTNNYGENRADLSAGDFTVREDDRPIITGATNTIINVGDTFDVLEGISAKDIENVDLTDRIVVSGDVDTQTIGTYTIDYSVSDDKGNTATVERQVEVIAVNVPPMIQGIENTTIQLNHWFDAMEGVTATDVEDGDLTNRIQVEGYVDYTVEGVYTITYIVVDDNMNETRIERQVEVVKTNTLPEIHGVENLKIKQNEYFEPLMSVYATDVEDGYLYNITTSGEVNMNIVGDYQLTYSVTDSDGNTTTVERTITVVSNATPILTGVKPKYIIQNQAFDPLTGISATDVEDGDLTEHITVRGTVDTSALG
ncbi:MAG: immunoglobulin-like domain-containing protein, partial [Culicoidibacterales bacterium]